MLFEVQTARIKSVTLPLRQRSRHVQKVCFTTTLPLISELTEYIWYRLGTKELDTIKLNTQWAGMSSALPRNILKTEVMKAECSAKNSVITLSKKNWIMVNGTR